MGRVLTVEKKGEENAIAEPISMKKKKPLCSATPIF